MTSFDFIDLFGGPGGWDVGAREIGLVSMGVEKDAATCRTRVANGLPTTECDVRLVDPLGWNARGLVASPPCQSFSRLGSGVGRQNLDRVVAGLSESLRGIDTLDDLDTNTRLVLEPMRWIAARWDVGDPFEWIAFEQVPSVLPVWEEYARILPEFGYDVTTALLTSEEYGVPQTRKRAILIAKRNGIARMPQPSHQRYKYGERSWNSVFELGWVSMRNALGPYMPEVNNQSGTDFDLEWQYDQPASVVAGRPLIPFRGANANRFNGSTKSRNDGWKVSLAQMGALQSFPADYAWKGTQGDVAQQIGNAIPPLMAKQILRQAVV